MHYHPTILIVLLSVLFQHSFAQETTTPTDTVAYSEIDYGSTPQKLEIAEITISGADNYEDFVLIGFSGLQVGESIMIPGEGITDVVRRFWKQGLFSDVKVFAKKIED